MRIIKSKEELKDEDFKNNCIIVLDKEEKNLTEKVKEICNEIRTKLKKMENKGTFDYNIQKEIQACCKEIEDLFADIVIKDTKEDDEDNKNISNVDNKNISNVDNKDVDNMNSKNLIDYNTLKEYLKKIENLMDEKIDRYDEEKVNKELITLREEVKQSNKCVKQLNECVKQLNEYIKRKDNLNYNKTNNNKITEAKKIVINRSKQVVQNVNEKITEEEKVFLEKSSTPKNSLKAQLIKLRLEKDWESEFATKDISFTSLEESEKIKLEEKSGNASYVAEQYNEREYFMAPNPIMNNLDGNKAKASAMEHFFEFRNVRENAEYKLIKPAIINKNRDNTYNLVRRGIIIGK